MYDFSLVVIGIFTLILYIWTFYKDFWQGPNIKVYAGDSVDIVKLIDKTTKKIHIACTFTNTSRKAGIVNKVAVLLKREEGSQFHLFNWQLFYNYQGGHIAHPESKVCPISISANDSTLQGIEFMTMDEINWHKGEYKIKVVAWVEKKLPFKKADMSDEFSIVLNQSFIEDLNKIESLSNSSLRTIMIKGRELKKEDMKGKI
jgi:hypothetical protein